LYIRDFDSFKINRPGKTKERSITWYQHDIFPISTSRLVSLRFGILAASNVYNCKFLCLLLRFGPLVRLLVRLLHELGMLFYCENDQHIRLCHLLLRSVFGSPTEVAQVNATKTFLDAI